MLLRTGLLIAGVVVASSEARGIGAALLNGVPVSLQQAAASQEAECPPIVVLLEIVNDPQKPAEERAEAMRRLAPAGLSDPVVVERLLKALHDEVGVVRLGAIDALTGHPDALADVIEALKSSLNEPAPTCCGAASRLGGLGSRARACVPELLQASRATSPVALRREALVALRQIGPEREAVLPHLRGLLRQPREDEELRVRAVELIGRVDPALEKTLPLLGELLFERGGGARLLEATGEALVSCGSQRAVPVLTRAVQHGNHAATLVAIRSLEKLGPMARPAVPALTEAAQEDDPAIAAAAQQALQRIGPAR
jgi:hypothetical protein